VTSARPAPDGRTHIVVQHKSAVVGIDAMTLLTDHVFSRHSHDQFGIGIMTAGAQRSWSCVGQVESEAGDVIMVNPGEMHDGIPIGGQARGWRMLYFDPGLVASQVETQQPEIVRPAVRDPALARVFAQLFAEVSRPVPDFLAIEENLLRSLTLAVRRHRTGHGEKSPGDPSPAVAAARQRLDAAPELPTTLAELAALSGVSRYQLLRGFARDVGITPHAYLIQRRVLLVRQLVTRKRSLAEAAAEAGFADQSHMTRAFVRQLGVTPARYRAALA
jgi:AraC-like DNA-binding protein